MSIVVRQPITWAKLLDNPDYVVNSEGGVAKLDVLGNRVSMVPQRDDGRGYLCCNIKYGNKYKTRKVHQLVMEAFLGKTPNGYHIDHMKEGKSCNALRNLRWRKSGENSADCRRGSRDSSRPVDPGY